MAYRHKPEPTNADKVWPKRNKIARDLFREMGEDTTYDEDLVNQRPLRAMLGFEKSFQAKEQIISLDGSQTTGALLKPLVRDGIKAVRDNIVRPSLSSEAKLPNGKLKKYAALITENGIMLSVSGLPRDFLVVYILNLAERLFLLTPEENQRLLVKSGSKYARSDDLYI